MSVYVPINNWPEESLERFAKIIEEIWKEDV